MARIYLNYMASSYLKTGIIYLQTQSRRRGEIEENADRSVCLDYYIIIIIIVLIIVKVSCSIFCIVKIYNKVFSSI